MMDKGFFNGLFDFNKDGQLNPVERTMDFMAFTEVMKATQNNVKQANEDEKDKQN